MARETRYIIRATKPQVGSKTLTKFYRRANNVKGIQKRIQEPWRFDSSFIFGKTGMRTNMLLGVLAKEVGEKSD